MEDFNPIGMTHTACRRTLALLRVMHGVPRPLVRGAVLALIAVALVVRTLNLDTVKVDLGTFPHLNSDIMPAGFHPLRCLDTEVARHPFKRQFVVTYGFEAMPEATGCIWTYDRWMRKLTVTDVDYGSGNSFSTAYSHVTDSVVHAVSKGQGATWENCGAVRGTVVRRGKSYN